jgi:mannose-6-phosphate isomerase-like protein (cupin superfamily)
MGKVMTSQDLKEPSFSFAVRESQGEAVAPTAEIVRLRSWGTVTLLEEGKHYRINRIEIKPGKHISTQMHFHRSEHWVVVSGTAKVTCDGEEKPLMQKQSTYVPTCTPHRVENPGVIPLVMIEIQNGEYLGEDDIIRFEEDASQDN